VDHGFCFPMAPSMVGKKGAMGKHGKTWDKKKGKNHEKPTELNKKPLFSQLGENARTWWILVVASLLHSVFKYPMKITCFGIFHRRTQGLRQDLGSVWAVLPGTLFFLLRQFKSRVISYQFQVFQLFGTNLCFLLGTPYFSKAFLSWFSGMFDISILRLSNRGQDWSASGVGNEHQFQSPGDGSRKLTAVLYRVVNIDTS